MKKLLSAIGLTAAAATLPACATAQTSPKTASFIEMTAAPGQTQAFSEFLTGAAPVVANTEPGTELWFAMRNDDTLVIFDVFEDAAARDAHFGGAVAAALKDGAPKLVRGGWEQGVLTNVANSEVLSFKAPVAVDTATTATYIKMRAAPGQSEALADLLTAAGDIVTETEPLTLYWAALRIDEDEFAIFDIFAGEEGRQAHFAGRVAGLLNQRAGTLVQGGWENGVVANVHNFEILASK